MNEQLKVIISAEISKFQKNVNDAKSKIKDFATKGIKDIDSFKESLNQAGETSKNALKVMGGAIAGAATALLALGASTKDYRQQQSMLKTAFETAGGSAESAKKTYNELYRVLGDDGQATEAAQHLAQLTTNQKDLSEWTNICQGVYAKFGESIPIEGLTEAINHTAKVGEVQGSLADALEWSGVNMDEFNEQLFWCNSESEREKLIRETLNGVYGEAAAAYETNNAAVLAQNEAQAQLTDAMAKLGEATAPILTMLTELGAQILTEITPHLQEFVDKYGEEIKNTLIGIGEAIGKVIKWIADNWDIIKGVAAVVLAIAAAIAILSAGITAYNVVMGIAAVVSAPIIAIIAAIIAVIALCIVYWDEIKAAGAAAWEWIKKAWSSAASWFNDKIVKPIVSFFKNMWNSVTTAVTNVVNGIKNTFAKVKDAISKPVEKARDTVKSIIDKIKGFFKFEWSLPKLKVPKFAITPSGWKVGDLLQGIIPKLGITWNARGGVFDKPTLFNYGSGLQGLGENGAEAVVPLENNLEWLNKLADMLGDRMGANTPIVLQVDGKTFARTAISTINNLTKQQGKLSLNVM